jgi:hypothetical protein
MSQHLRYSELTWRYFEAAPGVGTLGPEAARGMGGSREQGTWVQFDLLTASVDSGQRIEAVRFLAFGCPHTIAVAAYVAERAAGTAAVRRLPEPIAALQLRFEVPVEKLGRLLIVEDAWLAALGCALARVGPRPGG